MKLEKHFNSFLKHRVNLDDTRIDRLDSHVGAVEKFLSTGTDQIAASFIDLLPHGSYAQRTIIRPVGALDEFDADVLLELTEQNDWAADDYVQKVYEVFRGSSTYREKVSRKSRCVRVNYAGDFHIDVVPYLERHGERFITNRATNQFERTDPEGFNTWLDEQDRITSGRLVKVIRLMKFVRDFKNTFSVKSVILTILLGERVSGTALWADPDHYKDLPTAFVNILEDLDTFLQANPTMPSIDDPSCPSENFNHRWDQAQYATFRTKINYYAARARDALDETDREESYRKWRLIFGEDFGTYTEITKSSEAHLALAHVRNTDETLESRWSIPTDLDPRYSVKLVGRTTRRAGWRHYDLPTQGNVVRKSVSIDFRLVKVNVPEPFDVYWKVRNNGAEAFAADQMRGEVSYGGSSRTLREHTAYRGSHYVEVYIVKDGVCVASDLQKVIVR